MLSVNQGDTVELILQSSDIIRFRDGNKEQHDPSQLGYNNLANCIALVGFVPFQESCFNPNNYKNDFDNQDLNIVHNKNSGNEAILLLSPMVVLTYFQIIRWISMVSP